MLIEVLELNWSFWGCYFVIENSDYVLNFIMDTGADTITLIPRIKNS